MGKVTFFCTMASQDKTNFPGKIPENKKLRTLLWCTLLIFSYLIPYSLSAQEVSATLQLGRKEPQPLWFQYSSSDKGLVTLSYTTKNSSRSISLNKYDSKFQKKWTLPIIDQNGRKSIENLAVVGENILVFVAEFFPKEGEVRTYYYHYSLDGSKLADETLLDVSKGQKKNANKFNFILSSNKKKLLCYRKDSQAKENERLRFYVLDDQTNKLSEAGLELPYREELFTLMNMALSNSGDVYLLGKQYLTKNINSPDDFRFVIYQHHISDKKAVEIPLEFTGLYITDLQMKIDRESNIVISGFYSNRNAGTLGGVVYQRIDGKTLKLSTNTYERFPESVFTRYLNERQLEKGKEINNIYLDKIILRSDGGILLIAEQFYTTSSSYMDINGFYYTTTLYNYGDIMTVSVSGQGKIEWNSFIYKRQTSESPFQLSYIELAGPEALFFFYEYKEKNSGVNVYCNYIDTEGRVSDSKPIIQGYESGDVFYRNFSEQISNTEAILVYIKKKGNIFTLVKVSVN